MDFVPEGSLAISLASVAWCLARCPAWHTLTKVDAFDLADRFEKSLKKIHITTPPAPENGEVYRRDELEALRPYAVVYDQAPAMVPSSRELYVRRRIAHEQFGEWHTNWVQIVADVPEGLRQLWPKNANWMRNQISLLIDEILEASSSEPDDETKPMPIVQKIALLDGPRFPDADLITTQGYWSSAILQIDSGTGRP